MRRGILLVSVTCAALLLVACSLTKGFPRPEEAARAYLHAMASGDAADARRAAWRPLTDKMLTEQRRQILGTDATVELTAIKLVVAYEDTDQVLFGVEGTTVDGVETASDRLVFVAVTRGSGDAWAVDAIWLDNGEPIFGLLRHVEQADQADGIEGVGYEWRMRRSLSA